MLVAATVLSVVLAVVTLAAGGPKALLRGDVVARLRSRMGRGAGFVRFVGLAEAFAAVGPVVGLFWPPLGVVAAIGFAITMVGAVPFHAAAGPRAGPAHRAGALVPFLLLPLSIAVAVTSRPAM